MEWLLYITLLSSEPIKSNYEFESLKDCQNVGMEFIHDISQGWEKAGMEKNAKGYISSFTCKKREK